MMSAINFVSFFFLFFLWSHVMPNAKASWWSHVMSVAKSVWWSHVMTDAKAVWRSHVMSGVKLAWWSHVMPDAKAAWWSHVVSDSNHPDKVTACLMSKQPDEVTPCLSPKQPRKSCHVWRQIFWWSHVLPHAKSARWRNVLSDAKPALWRHVMSDAKLTRWRHVMSDAKSAQWRHVMSDADEGTSSSPSPIPSPRGSLQHHRWLHKLSLPCFSVPHCPLGLDELQAYPLPNVVFQPLFLPCLLLRFTVPCKMVLARLDEWETWPYLFNLRQEVFIWSAWLLDLGTDWLVFFSAALLWGSMIHRHAGRWMWQGSASVVSWNWETCFCLSKLVSTPRLCCCRLCYPGEYFRLGTLVIYNWAPVIEACDCLKFLSVYFDLLDAAGVACHQLRLLGTDLHAVGCGSFAETLN